MCNCLILKKTDKLGILRYNFSNICASGGLRQCLLCNKKTDFSVHHEAIYINAINPYYFSECQLCHQYAIYVLMASDVDIIKKEVCSINDVFLLKAIGFIKYSVWYQDKYCELSAFTFDKNNLEEKVKTYLTFS